MNSILSSKIVGILLLLSRIAWGLSNQQTVLALCTHWGDSTCQLHSPPNVIQNYFQSDIQSLCKADITLLAQQIDWQSPSGGKGSITSVKVNQEEMLAEQIYPSTSYLIPAYPKCNAWYDCFAPFGNVVAVESATKKSIIDVAQSNLITLEVQLDWTGGPHSAPFPVCSSDGVSYAAVIRLDYYYEVQEKKLCSGWNPETKTVCSDNGKCLCAERDGISRTCTCKSGYGPPDCSDCSSDRYGDSCTLSCESCYNGGTCSSGLLGNGTCSCKPGFDPLTRCATCLPKFYGLDCRACPDCNYPHGNCVDGIAGNGECACEIGFDINHNCSNCMGNYFGPDCRPCDPCGSGTCNHGTSGTGNCLCPVGFEVNNSRCSECLPGYFGPNCTKCHVCHNDGVCKDGINGDGTCDCPAGYATPTRCLSCSDGWDFNPATMKCQCAPEHFGPHCRSCPICAPHGKCNAGEDGDGNCICDVGWSDSNNCVGCMNGYYGFNCQECPYCGNGKCDDGLKGTGVCVCHHGWNSSTNCFECSDDHFGPNCELCPVDCGDHGQCSSGLNGTGSCACDPGWKLQSPRPCTTCEDGYFGPRCDPCPGMLTHGVPCSGHGVCKEVNKSAVCVCDARYIGLSCTTYEFPITMVAVLALVSLTTLGICMCSMRTLARRPGPGARGGFGQLGGGSFGSHMNNNNSLFNRSDYVEISDMADLELFVSADTRDWLIPFESLTLQYEVGNGTSGQVFKSMYHSGGGSSIVAVKRLYSPITGQEYFQNFFRREVSILSKLHHPNVVRFYGVSYYSRILYIVTDFCPASLSDLIENPSEKGSFEHSFFLKIVIQITSGMGFLHSRSVVHRDLKPANVLLTDQDDVNICDFGLSRLLDPDMTSMTAEVGTPSYMAPEMATMGETQCSTKGDVYSFGILLYSMWTRSKPYGDQGMNPFQLMTAVVNGLRPVIPINCPEGLAKMMNSCWDANPVKRPSFPEISLMLKDDTLLTTEDNAEISEHSLKMKRAESGASTSRQSSRRLSKETDALLSSPHHQDDDAMPS